MDWPNVLCINNNNVNLSFGLFYENVNKLILKHAPLKKLTTQEKKLCLKPWITTGILTSIKTKNRIYRKFLCTKNATTKQQLHNHFKYYWNNLTKITKASKALHYKEFFEDNKGNLWKTWEGSREIINISKKKETDDKWYIWQKFSTRWSTSYIQTFQTISSVMLLKKLKKKFHNHKKSLQITSNNHWKTLFHKSNNSWGCWIRD